MKKTFIYIALILFFTGCSRPPVLFKETRLLMDTFAEISVYSVDKDKALKAIKEAFEAIKHAEKEFNRFDSKSEISKVNRLSGEMDVSISPELFNIIEDSIGYSRLSGGSFDITVSPEKKGRYEEIILDEDRSSVRFLSPDLKIDLGGIAKGYAIDRAKDVLVANGIENALVNIGGNIYALGDADGKKGWVVGIRHPDYKDKVIKKLKLKDRAISTSGDYERGPHIIDPATGEPAEGIISVTVVADSAEKADAFSTAIFTMGSEKAGEFVKSSKEHIEVFILDDKGVLIKYP